MGQSKRSFKRPLWFVILGAIIGAVAVSAIIAFAAYHFFYVIILYSALLGICGAVFVWMVADEVNQQGTWLAGAAGAIVALLMYILYRYIAYLLATNDMDIAPTFWEYTRMQAEAGSTFTGRSGSSSDGLSLGETLTWGLWSLEIGIAMFCGGFGGKNMDVDTSQL